MNELDRLINFISRSPTRVESITLEKDVWGKVFKQMSDYCLRNNTIPEYRLTKKLMIRDVEIRMAHSGVQIPTDRNQYPEPL